MFSQQPNILQDRRTIIFNAKGADWQAYNVSPNAVAIQIFMMGAGGGGGNGFTAAAGTARGGGGGGGSGGLFRAVIPTLLLPDTLFLQPGVGGGSGVAGGASVIASRPPTATAFNIYTVGGGGAAATQSRPSPARAGPMT